ncbi:MAG: putative DNA-binding domain-containing protein [Thiohalocapsa sp.]
MPERAAQPDPTPGFIATQMAFAAHIRDPSHAPPPADVDDRRAAIYRELFFKSLSGLLKNGFPVLYGILGKQRWHALIRDFMVQHRAKTPLFLEVSQEFLDYLSRRREGQATEEPPFLLELAHYEWVELALDVSDEAPDPHHADPNGDLLDGIPVVSPLAWSLSYRFPVHKITPEVQPEAPGDVPTHLLVYRNRAERVERLEINATTQRLLTLLREGEPRTGRQALLLIASELSHPEPDQVVAGGRRMLADLRRRDVILGTRWQGDLNTETN